MKRKWSINDIPNLNGKVAIVTGGNKGLGYKSSLELARKGATVIIGCRDENKGKEAIASIKKEAPNAKLDVIPLDLVSKDSIQAFAERFLGSYKRLDILLNNAGVVNLEKLSRTKEGREMHMATNHLGHFMLTGLLFPIIKSTNNARVVTVSSGAYKFSEIRFDDFDWQSRAYDRGKSYGESKLANLLFMYQLQTYFDKAGVNAISLSAHPGLTATKRQQTIGMGGGLARVMASPIETGCSPQLFAATAPDVKPRELYGPKYLLRGAPAAQKLKETAIDDKVAKQLWELSEKLTGIHYDV